MSVHILNIDEITVISEKYKSPFLEFEEKVLAQNDLKLTDKNFVLTPFTHLGFYNFSTPIQQLIVDQLAVYPSSTQIILVEGSGDYVLKVHRLLKPFNVKILCLGGNKQLGNAYSGFPVLWGDPWQQYYSSETPKPRMKNNTPVIGFCGLGKNSITELCYRVIKQCFFNLKSYIGYSHLHPEPFLPSSFMRSKILKCLGTSALVVTNFTLHNKYKAGISSRGTKEEFEVRKQFYENINHSDYTICMRGQGNFSVRFYETLAMGRIPIVYDTDQLWPYLNSIDYSQVGLFIDASKVRIKDIPFLILAYHNSLTDEQFIAKQQLNRTIWLNYMTKEGFGNKFDLLLN